jgi:hypothetical protein
MLSITRADKLKEVPSYRSVIRKSAKWAVGGNMLNIPVIGFTAGMAERGERVAALSGPLFGLATYPAMAAATAAMLCMVPFCPPMAIPFLAGVIAIYPNGLLEESVTGVVKALSKEGNRVGRLQMGGKYTDTPYASQQRQNAMAELTYAAQTSRRVLGQESMFLHGR